MLKSSWFAEPAVAWFSKIKVPVWPEGLEKVNCPEKFTKPLACTSFAPQLCQNQAKWYRHLTSELESAVNKPALFYFAGKTTGEPIVWLGLGL